MDANIAIVPLDQIGQSALGRRHGAAAHAAKLRSLALGQRAGDRVTIDCEKPAMVGQLIAGSGRTEPAAHISLGDAVVRRRNGAGDFRARFRRSSPNMHGVNTPLCLFAPRKRRAPRIAPKPAKTAECST